MTSPGRPAAALEDERVLGERYSVDFDGYQPDDEIYHVYASTADVSEQIGIWTGWSAMVHGDGLVAWIAQYDAPPGLYYSYGLTVYDTVTGQVRLVAADESMDRRLRGVVGISDGWLIWTSSDGTSSPAGFTNRTAHALRTVDIRAAFDALGDLE